MSFLDDIGKAAGNAAKAAGDAAGDAADAVGGAVDDAGKAIDEAGRDARKELGDGAMDVIIAGASVWRDVKGVAGGVNHVLGGVPGDILDGAVDVINEPPQFVRDALLAVGSVALFTTSPPLFAAAALGTVGLARGEHELEIKEGRAAAEKDARDLAAEKEKILADREANRGNRPDDDDKRTDRERPIELFDASSENAVKQ